MRRIAFEVWACLFLMLTPLAGQQKPYYSITKLPLPAGHSLPLGINDSGQIVGVYLTTEGSDHAFFWSTAGGVQDLGTLGGDNSVAFGISHRGQIVGTAQALGTPYHAFLWTQASGMRDLGTFGGAASGAFAVNNSGQVVGEFCVDPSQQSCHAFLWSEAGGMQDLGTLGGITSAAFAINDSGQVAGQSQIPSGEGHAFVWSQAGGMQDIGPVGTTSQANSINSHGQIVGTFSDSGHWHAFLWTRAGGMRDLGMPAGDTLSIANSINNSGHVVGWSDDERQHHIGFLWSQSSGIQNLNDLGAHGPDGLLNGAGAINRAGQIAGQVGVTNSSAEGVVLLTPKMYPTITSSLNPSTVGETVTFTATVNSPVQGPPPNGDHVIFTSSMKVLAIVPLKGGVASFSTSTLKAGKYGIRATFAGDVNYASGAYAVVTHAGGRELIWPNTANPTPHPEDLPLLAGTSSA